MLIIFSTFKQTQAYLVTLGKLDKDGNSQASHLFLYV